MTRLFDSDERYTIIRGLKDTCLFNSVSLIDIEFYWSDDLNGLPVKWNVSNPNKIYVSSELRKCEKFSSFYKKIVFLALLRKSYIKNKWMFKLLSLPLVRIFFHDYLANIISSLENK